MTLNVNIDHIATLRNARNGVEPDPVTAAVMCELAGASGIVCHLREDRRHVKERDVRALREILQVKLDLEMAAVKEIINFAVEVKPDLVTIVPEKRQELTTEGGLDLTENIEHWTKLVDKMHDNGIEVSFFVEPDEKQMEAALVVGADMVELHTGVYANLKPKDTEHEFKKIKKAAEFAFSSGLQVAAGHGLNYFNTAPIAKIPQIQELSIGHSIMARSILVGLDRAVRDMLNLIHQ